MIPYFENMKIQVRTGAGGVYYALDVHSDTESSGSTPDEAVGALIRTVMNRRGEVTIEEVINPYADA